MRRQFLAITATAECLNFVPGMKRCDLPVSARKRLKTGAALRLPGAGAGAVADKVAGEGEAAGEAAAAAESGAAAGDADGPSTDGAGAGMARAELAARFKNGVNTKLCQHINGCP